uniref:TANGO6 HEAT repeat domain-containing protein n=1 Tax=Eptatretus burgeri TaxID=7764 RepID=A0A8C4PWU9_EPTBU
MAVKDLLVLQGTPKQTPAWLRNACGHLLSKRLAQSDGVQAVILGVLEGTTGGGIEDDAVFDWQKCDGVARVISRCPRHCSADHYYQSICPQVLSLLHSSDGPAARCMHHVAVRVVVTLAREHPGLAKHLLLDPLVEPLVRCLENNDSAQRAERRSGLEKEVKLKGRSLSASKRGALQKEKVVKTERRAVGREDCGETERRCVAIDCIELAMCVSSRL